MLPTHHKRSLGTLLDHHARPYRSCKLAQSRNIICIIIMDITDPTVAASAKLSEASARQRMHMSACTASCADRLSQRSPPAATLVAHSPPRTVPSCRPAHTTWPRRKHQASEIQAAQTRLLDRAAHCTHSMRAGACASTLARRWRHQNHRQHSQTCALSSNDEVQRYVENGSRKQNCGLERNRDGWRDSHGAQCGCGRACDGVRRDAGVSEVRQALSLIHI